MYKCNKCGSYVDSLVVERETVGFKDGEPIIEEYENDTCSCGGWLMETAVCERCKNDEIDEYFEDDMCWECQKELFVKFIQLLQENFTNKEVDFIRENWEDLEDSEEIEKLLKRRIK